MTIIFIIIFYDMALLFESIQYVLSILYPYMRVKLTVISPTKVKVCLHNQVSMQTEAASFRITLSILLQSY